MDLRGYERAKFALSELLQSAGELSGDKKTDANKERIAELLVRLAEDRLSLAFIGRFSRGKSSLMNAILGVDRLPTGIVPLTSVITTVSYGTSEKVTIKYRQRRLDSEIALAELPQYVTEFGNPGNRLGIATANIELPVEILRRGFYFVDTPGLGSVIAENTQTTQAFLPEADALVLVTSFEGALSEEEHRFVVAATRARQPVFVVVNKHDLVTVAEREEALAFAHARLQAAFDDAPPEVFSVSARDGLAAKRAGDVTLLRDSGLQAFEERIGSFLLGQKREVFLARMHSRITDLIDDLPSFPRLVELRRDARAFGEKYREGLNGREAAPLAGDLASIFNRNQLRPCQVCAEIEKKTWAFLARYQYELATSHDSQADFAARSGFCCYHTWEYQSVASPHGTSTGFPPLLERLAASLHAVGASCQPEPASAVKALLPTHDNCVVCAARDQAEALALRDLSNRLRRDVKTALDELSALCLPHLAALAEIVDDSEITRALANHHASTYERVAEDMRRFTLKQDAARRQLETEEENTAAQRGLLLVAGRRNANFAVGHASRGARPRPSWPRPR